MCLAKDDFCLINLDDRVSFFFVTCSIVYTPASCMPCTNCARIQFQLSLNVVTSVRGSSMFRRASASPSTLVDGYLNELISVLLWSIVIHQNTICIGMILDLNDESSHHETVEKLASYKALRAI